MNFLGTSESERDFSPMLSNDPELDADELGMSLHVVIFGGVNVAAPAPAVKYGLHASSTRSDRVVCRSVWYVGYLCLPEHTTPVNWAAAPSALPFLPSASRHLSGEIDFDERDGYVLLLWCAVKS